MTRQPVIAVCGAGSCDKETADTAYKVGKEIAAAGAVMVCGGMGGVMEAASRGASEAGGVTIGILPGESADDANPWIEVAVVTAMSHARNAIIVRTADSVVAVGGAYGTLSEIALALKMGKPVISLRSWQVSDDIIPARDPEQAVALALCRRPDRG